MFPSRAVGEIVISNETVGDLSGPTPAQPLPVGMVKGRPGAVVAFASPSAPPWAGPSRLRRTRTGCPAVELTARLSPG